MTKHIVKKSKYSTYSKLSALLLRLNIKHSGKVATLLLDTFVNNHSEEASIRSEDVVSRGICKKGKFTELRDLLIGLDILSWKMTDKTISYDSRYQASLFKPGGRIVKYINEEKVKNNVIATMNDLASKADVKDVEALKERISQMEKKHDKLVIQYFMKNPPDTPERRRLLEEAVEKNVKFTH